MDDATARLLRAETARFYRTCPASFSATRQLPWDGWPRVLDVALGSADPAPRAAPADGRATDPAPRAAPADGRATDPAPRALRVLDLGCGNYRFERFLTQRCPVPWEAVGIDACAPLASAPPKSCTFVPADLAVWEPPPAFLQAFDLVVAFGLMHHLPGDPLRRRLVAAMASCAAPGGHVALSLWQLRRDPRLAERADQATRRFLDLHPSANLDSGDALLGWQGRDNVFRYCHSFSDNECAQLAQGHACLRLVDQFDADLCNRYLVFAAR